HPTILPCHRRSKYLRQRFHFPCFLCFRRPGCPIPSFFGKEAEEVMGVEEGETMVGPTMSRRPFPVPSSERVVEWGE
ncbi:MAG: hypothetical protein Q4C47_00405, partial [Planctomycetia bacterium]|nr:hypothetical protein [Planctomycetia bacterium]